MLSTELRKLGDVNAVTVPANFVKMLELVSGNRFAWDLVGKKLNLKSRKRSKAMKASIVKKLTCLVLALVASFSVFASATHCRTTEGAKWTIELSIYEDRIEYEVSRARQVSPIHLVADGSYNMVDRMTDEWQFFRNLKIIDDRAVMTHMRFHAAGKYPPKQTQSELICIRSL